MNPIVESRRTGDFILSEANGTLSRETKMLRAGSNLKAGTVLGYDKTSPNVVSAYDRSGGMGLADPIGVLYSDIDATEGDTQCVVITRCAEVVKEMLIFHYEQDPSFVETFFTIMEGRSFVAR